MLKPNHLFMIQKGFVVQLLIKYQESEKRKPDGQSYKCSLIIIYCFNGRPLVLVKWQFICSPFRVLKIYAEVLW